MAGGMTPDNDQIVGGEVLRLPAVHSPGFVSGSTGWSINGDGSAEFNNVVSRGSIQSGTAPGARFLINPGNGDIVDVYDSANELIMKIDSNGILSEYVFSATSQHVFYEGDGLHYVSDLDASTAFERFFPSTTTNSHAQLRLSVTNNDGLSTYTLTLAAGSDLSPGASGLSGTERGVSGSVVQADTSGSLNLVHAAAISGTTDGSGFLTFNHGASFTPTMILCQAHGAGTPSFGTTSVIDGSITSTQAKVLCFNLNGTVRAGAAVTFWVWCIG